MIIFPCFFDFHTLPKQSYGELGETESNGSGKQESESTVWMTRVLILKTPFGILIDKERPLELCVRVVLKRLDVLASVLSSRIYESQNAEWEESQMSELR